MEVLLNVLLSIIISKKFLAPILYILLGVMLYNLIIKIINKVIEKRNKNNKKQKTVVNLIKNIIKYLIIVIVILLILETYGVNTTSIIASLGVVGVVIGLAFQDTIKNMLAGIFIIFDNRYNVGDYVLINSFTGKVVSLGLQTTKIEASTGEVFTIANSQINTVINYSENDSLLVIDLSVSYNTDLKHLESVLSKLNNKVKKIENVKGDLNLLGVQDFLASEIQYRISVLCKPYTHFGVKREILKLIKIEFDKENIVIPYNQIDLHLVEDTTKKKK